MRCVRYVISILLLAAGATPSTKAGEMPALKDAADKLRAATVTVRVRNPRPDQDVLGQSDGDKSDAEADADARESVTVCSGVAVGDKLVVTPIYAASDSEIRVTLVGGDQTAARLRVLDEYSGLALIETTQHSLTAIESVHSQPVVGSWVLSAAAWGTEQASVSFGIVSAVERTLAGAVYPPLLQCDLRTAETSSGAGVVDGHGRLLGIVIAADERPGNRGWTYAVPTRHVQRLVRTLEEGTSRESVIILKRRRPTVGMVLGGGPEGIVVSRVHEGSPAERAGIQVGDKVLAADGVKIRSVYQAVRPVLYRQPGDKMEFLIDHRGDIRMVEVVLGGGVELPSAPFANLGQYIRPKLDVEKVSEGVYASRSGQNTLREVFSPTGLPDSNPPGNQTMTSVEKIQLLEKALDRYRGAIKYLQDRLSREQQEREQTDALLRSLQNELDEVKKRLSQELLPIE